MQKINQVYKVSNLFDGLFDGKTVRINKIRILWNRLNQYFSYLIALIHLIVFIFDDKFLINELTYYRISKALGYRYLNLGKFISFQINF